MKKITLTIAAIMVLMVSTFAQHHNPNGYYQQSSTYWVGGGQYAKTSCGTTITYGHHGNHHQNNYYNQNNNNPQNASCTNYSYNQYNCAPANYNYPMSQRDFEYAKQSIASKGFDETRLIMAKQVVASNRLLSGQVEQLMNLMSFESTKLELAKYAWNHTLDRENYYRINDAFSFESSVCELNKYIQYN